MNFGSFYCVIYLDLDNFGKVVEAKNWTEYSPNPITRALSRMIDEYRRETFAQILWGYDEDRGTEECILAISQNRSNVIKSMEDLRQEIENISERHNADTSVSIGIACGQAPTFKPLSNTKKNTLKQQPLLFTAYKALQEAKRKGGNTVICY